MTDFTFKNTANFLELFEYVKAIPEELDYPFLSDQDAEETLAACAAEPTCSMNFLYEGDTRIGALVLAKSSHWWSAKEFLTNVVLFVHPSHRSSKAFNSILSYSEEVAKKNNIELIFDFVGESAEKAEKLLAKKKYKKVGVSFKFNHG